MQGTDQDLVTAALRERKAFAAIVARYEDVLRRFVTRLLGARSAGVDDVLQETFIKAFLNLNDYDLARPFTPWIYRIAHNEAVNFLRRRRIERETIAGDEAELLLQRIAAVETADAGWVRSSGEAMLQLALSALDVRYRDVLVLRFLEEKSYDDIADIMTLPPGTVATFIRRGLARLRVMMEQGARI